MSERLIPINKIGGGGTDIELLKSAEAQLPSQTSDYDYWGALHAVEAIPDISKYRFLMFNVYLKTGSDYMLINNGTFPTNIVPTTNNNCPVQLFRTVNYKSGGSIVVQTLGAVAYIWGSGTSYQWHPYGYQQDTVKASSGATLKVELYGIK